MEPVGITKACAKRGGAEQQQRDSDGPLGDGGAFPGRFDFAGLVVGFILIVGELCQVEFFLVQERIALDQHGAAENFFDLLEV